MFVSVRTFYSLETTLSMPGVALFNCIISAAGLILMYQILPETENRTLEEIEMHFADGTKKLTDRKIPKLKVRQNVGEIPTRPVLVIEIQESTKKHTDDGCENRAFADDEKVKARQTINDTHPNTT